MNTGHKYHLLIKEIYSLEIPTNRKLELNYQNDFNPCLRIIIRNLEYKQSYMFRYYLSELDDIPNEFIIKAIKNELKNISK